MFFGCCHSKLDDKNRVKVPKKVLNQLARESTSKSIYITFAVDECLFMFTEEGWQERRQRMKDTPMTKTARKFERVFFGNAEELVPDSMGRFVLPEHQREWLGNAREIVFLGVKNRFEIWSAADWRTFSSDSDDDFESIAEGILM